MSEPFWEHLPYLQLARVVRNYINYSPYVSQPCYVQDMDNTVGSWSLYADDDPKRYPALQEEFFERAAAPLVDRRVQIFFTAGRKWCC